MPSLARKLAQNTIVQIGGRFLATLLGVASVAVFTRLLGADGYGQLTVILTFLTLFAVVVDFGLTVTTVQMISEQPEEEARIIGNMLTLRIVSAVAFLAVAPIAALFFPYAEVVKIGIAIGTVSYLFGTTSQMLVGVFQKRLLMGRVMFAELINRAIVFFGAILFGVWHVGILGIVALLVVGNAMQLLVMVTLARRELKLSFRYERALFRKIISLSWPIGLSLVFNLLYLRGDILFLSLWSSNTEIGIYGFAYKIVDVMTTLPVMYMGLVLPLLVAAWTKRTQDFTIRMQEAFDVFSLIALPLAIGPAIVGVPLMRLLGGDAFSDSGRVLTIFGPVIALLFFGSLFSHAVIALNKQRVMTWGYAIVAVITVIGYVVFIPQYGIWAAAWMTLLAESLITIATGYVVLKTSGWRPRITQFTRAFLGSCVMAVFLLIVSTPFVLLNIVLATGVYAITISLLGGPNPKSILRLFLPEKPPISQA